MQRLVAGDGGAEQDGEGRQKGERPKAGDLAVMGVPDMGRCQRHQGDGQEDADEGHDPDQAERRAIDMGHFTCRGKGSRRDNDGRCGDEESPSDHESGSMTQPPGPANRKPLRRSLVALLCAGLALAACRMAAPPLPPASMIDALAAADILLIGEQHDNAEHHRLQAWIVGELAKRERPLVVAFEMIDESQRGVLDDFLKGWRQPGGPRDAATLGGLLAWDASGWPDWALYQPIADAALAQRAPPAVPILPANLPVALVRDIARSGLDAPGLDAALAETLRQAQTRDAAVLAVHAADIRESHCGMLPERLLGSFALAQYARDDAMARSLQRAYLSGARAVLIAGNGHARRDVGVPLHLARLLPNAKVLSVGLLEGTANDSQVPFDHVWRTVSVERGDPCAAFGKPAG